MHETIDQLVVDAARRFGDKTALVTEHRTLTFSEVNRLAEALAAALHDLGLKPGDRISIFSPNCWEWVVSYYAIFKLGAVANPLNLMLTAEEANYAMDDCGSRCVFAGSSQAARLLAMPERGEERIVVTFGEAMPGALPFEKLIERNVREATTPALQASDLSTVCYTSGTTGHPKGAMQTHRSVVLNTALTSTMHVRTEHDTVVSALPCSHVYGNVVMNSAFFCGLTLVLHASFDAAAILRSIGTHKATMFEGVPTMYHYLLESPELDLHDLGSLTRCTVGGQTMPVERMEAVQRRLGCPLVELWGMTELAGLGTTFPFHGPRKLGSIGLPLPMTEARIVDPSDPSRTLAHGEPGELQIKGPLVMSGYYGNEAATRECLQPDGWLRTGDIAHRDEEGFIYVVDRFKDMILTGGYNIYPAEIERVISRMPGVSMVAVGRVPDEVKGELARAYVVPASNQSLTEEGVIEFCRQHLAAYKVPRSVAFVADLPKTSSGKILRRKLHTLDAALQA